MIFVSKKESWLLCAADYSICPESHLVAIQSPSLRREVCCLGESDHCAFAEALAWALINEVARWERGEVEVVDIDACYEQVRRVNPKYGDDSVRVMPKFGAGGRCSCDAAQRARHAAQVLIDEIGAEGPQNVEQAAQRAVELIRHYREGGS